MDPDVSQLVTELELIIPESMTENKINACSLAIVGISGHLWSKGYGYADHVLNPASSWVIHVCIPRIALSLE